MSRYPEVLFQVQPSQMLEFFFMFSLQVLNGKEPLPKAAAADFWVSTLFNFLAISCLVTSATNIGIFLPYSQTAFITAKSEDPNLQATLTNAMNHLGPLIAQTLIQNVGGNAARSELDKLSDPLKKLVVQQPRAQQWLEQALLAESFPGAQVTPQERLLFLKKIVS